MKIRFPKIYKSTADQCQPLILRLCSLALDPPTGGNNFSASIFQLLSESLAEGAKSLGEETDGVQDEAVEVALEAGWKGWLGDWLIGSR